MFGTVDFIVFSASAFLSLAIGLLIVWFGGNPTTGLAYFLGGRKQHFIPVLLSLLVSNHSSILMLGGPAESYMYGAMYLIGFLGFLPLIPLFTRVTVPLFYKLKLTSVYRYFDKRFPTNTVRLLMVVIGSIRLIVYSGLVMFGPAVALQHVTPLPDWAIILGCSAITILYTCVGGFSAVIWTDVFQCMVMFAGMLAVLIKCTMEAGGVSQVLTVASHHKRLDFFDFNPDPTVRHTFWTLVIGSAVQCLNQPFGQSTVQRLNAMQTIRMSNYVVLIYLVLLILFEVLASACGIVSFAYYAKSGCDPLAAKLISNPNQIMIKTITDVFKHLPGMSGLYMSALLCASISTLSSCLNGVSAMLYDDVIKVYWPELSDRQATGISKLLVIVSGCLAAGAALMIRFVKGSLTQITLSILGALAGPTIAIFLLALFLRRLTTTGSLAGVVVGTAFGAWIILGSQTMPPSPRFPPGPTTNCLQMTGIQGSPNATNLLGQDFVTTGQDNASDMTLNRTLIDFVGDDDNNSSSLNIRGIRKMYTVSYKYFFALSLLITAIVATIVSLLKPSKYRVPEDHLVSLTTAFCGCCSHPPDESAISHTNDEELSPLSRHQPGNDEAVRRKWL